MSPEEQRDANARFAKLTGSTIVHSVDETDSVSGGSVDRVGLQGALSMVQDGEADGIVVAKVDRFSRTLLGGLRVISEMEERGHWLLSAREGVIVGDERATATDKLVRHFWLMLAEWQRDTLAEGWEETRARANAAGVARIVPYGYVRDETRRAVPDGVKADAVREMFRLRLTGMTPRAIADELHGRGFPGARDGDRVTLDLVRGVLKSRTYLGELRDGEFVNVASHEPLVDVETWERVNSAPGTSRVGERNVALLAGLARCSACGQKLVARTAGYAGKDGKRRRRYSCRAHYSWGECPAPVTVDEQSLDAYVESVFRDDFMDVEAEGVFTSDALDGATRAREAAEADLRAYVKLVALQRAEPAIYAEGVEERTRLLSAARDEEEKLRNAARGFALPEDIGVTWPNLSTPEKRAYLGDAYVAVVVRRKTDEEPRLRFDAARVRIVGRDEENAPELLSGACNPLTVAA